MQCTNLSASSLHPLLETQTLKTTNSTSVQQLSSRDKQHGLVKHVTSTHFVIHSVLYLKPYQHDFNPSGLGYGLVGGLDGFDFHLRDFLRLFRHRRDRNAVCVTIAVTNASLCCCLTVNSIAVCFIF